MDKLKEILSNIFYTVGSNLLAFLVSTVTALFLPKILGIESYGYFQLYLFYVSYVGFLHLGWCDGVYLRYGGKEYKTLDYPLFKGQFYSLFIFQLILSLVFLVLIVVSDMSDINKMYILIATTLNIILMNMRTFLIFVLQATNRMKDYSIITISDRLIFIIIAVILMAFKVDSFYAYVLGDLVAKLISLIVSISKAKEITSLSAKVYWDLKESKTNIVVGSNLMFANIASTLIIGIVRFGIQSGWDVSVFGQISLTLSISNMLMVFVNAISMAIFPLLKRESDENYVGIYQMIKTLLMPTVLGLLIVYYPLHFILIRWLPDYTDTLRYMAIVFPIIVFEAKVGLLTGTYLKALRKEKTILTVNVLTVVVSLVLTFIIVNVFHNLFLSMILIVFLLAFRSIASEIMLSKSLPIAIGKDTVLELILVIIFIGTSWSLPPLHSLVIYVLSLCVYFLLKRKDIIQVKNKLVSLKGR